MRAFRVLAFLACAASALAVSCSSAPPKSDTVTTVKNQAAEAVTFGNAYYRQGRYDLALQFFTQALDYYTSVDNAEGVIQSYNAIGQVYLAMDQFDKAEDIFSQARADSRGAGESLFFATSINLGELYLKKGEPQKALAIFQEALGVPAGKLTVEQTGVLYHNLGTAYKNIDDPVKALEYFGKSLEINIAHKLFEETAADYYMIASVHSRQGDFSAAAKNAELALSYDKRIENSQGIAMDLYALGLIANRRKDSEAAYGYFQRSYLVYTTLGMKADMKKALAELIAAADTLGRTAEVESYRKALADLESP